MSFHKESVVASYPYHFDVDDKDIGVITAYVYDQVNVEGEERQKVLQQLADLETQDHSGYSMIDDKVVYQSTGNVLDYKDLEHAEVGIRRHFIEDFIETDEDLKKIVSPYHAHTLKTEFIID